jgi:alcohol dehydrogenase class IV
MPHGLANALVLPAAVRYNAEAVPKAMGRIAVALGAGEDGDPATAIEQLRERLGLPSRLSDVGVTDDDLDAVARMAEGNASVRNNPRPVTEESARELLETIF